LKADFALLDSKRASDASPHEGEAGESHRRSLVAIFFDGQTQVTVICNFSENSQAPSTLEINFEIYVN